MIFVPPFQGWLAVDFYPRALPWAGMGEAVGLPSRWSGLGFGDVHAVILHLTRRRGIGDGPHLTGGVFQATRQR